MKPRMVVAELMEVDESISQEIATTEKTITESATTTQELNARLDMITEARKMNRDVAVVKIGGNVFSETKITGLHGTLVHQEDLKRLSIVEMDKPDHEGVKRWRFELNPFR